MKNGIAKNFEVVREEVSAWWAIMKTELARFRDADLFGQKTSILHLLVNLQTETRRALPRTLTYLSILFWGMVTIFAGALLIFYVY